MTKSQLKSIKYFINNAEQFFRFYDTINGVSYINGPVLWSIEKTADGRYWLRADNNTSERKWFDKLIFVNALIGKRGGVKIYSCSGIESKYLTI